MSGMWNLSELYSGPHDPAIEQDMLEAERQVAKFVAKWKSRTDYLESPAVLRVALDEYEALFRGVGTGSRPAYFFTLSRAIDQSNAELKGLQSSLHWRSTVMSESLQFFGLSIGELSQSMQDTMLTAVETAPYHVWLKHRFEKASHDLSEEMQLVVNRLLPLATESWRSLLDGLLSNDTAKIVLGGEEKSVPFNALSRYLVSDDSKLAKQANDEHVRIARRHSTVAEHELNAVITAKIRMSELRGYDRPDSESFERNIVTSEIVESMLSTIEQRYAISHGVYDLKAQLFGRETLGYHERVLTYGTLPSGYTFEQGSTLLRGVFDALHPKFAVEFDRALANGHIDHTPRTGKRGGAACWRSAITLPPYLLLSFTGALQDIQTLGHEFGHYLNNLYMQSGGKCDSLTYGAPTPLAEVASTFFEEYVLDHIVRGSDDETRLAVLLASLDRNVASVFRQAAATRFEQELYREIDAHGYLSKEQIGELFTHHMAAYMGPRIDLADGADVGWIHWGHFRMGFYNYGYTFAQLVSIALQERVNTDRTYIVEFERLLETGSSSPTSVLLDSMGLNVSDGSVWNASLDKIQRQLNEATELAAALGKI